VLPHGRAKVKGHVSVTTTTPSFVEPMAAKVVDHLPEGDRWLYEVKWDGYRALIIKRGPQVRIRSRNDKDLTASYPAVVAAAAGMRANSAVVDGEIVALDAGGRPSFQALQHRTAIGGHVIVFYAFDLLHENGEDLRRLPLEERRRRLQRVTKGSTLLVSDVLEGSAARVVEAVAAVGLEGVIAKRKDSRYEAGERSGAWVKFKLERQQEFVVGGYRPGPHGVDALLVGVYRGRSLMFAGKVRAGFTPHLRREVFGRLQGLDVEQCPFANLPTLRRTRWGSGVPPEEMDEMQWVRPAVVAQIRFVEWTAEEQLRHSAFIGLRDDKKASSVKRET
jgi:bifunctional non-homologous end joining protein LigD